MTKKFSTCGKCSTIAELLKRRHQNYPDRSVEYAIALALVRAGVEKLKFGSFGVDKKPSFNSIAAYPNIGQGYSLLIELLRHFGFRCSGGAGDSSMQASFLYEGEPISYIKGYYITGTDQDQVLLKVYACFNWLKENPEVRE